MKVAELIWPARRPRIEGIESLAERIAAGDPPSAAEIVAVLEAARCTEEDLQAAVDRHERVQALRRLIDAAAPDVKRFDAIDAEMKAAAAAAEKAVADAEATYARLGRDHAILRARCDAAKAAREELLDPKNLPPEDAAAVAAMDAEAAAAIDTAAAARVESDQTRRSLEAAQEALAAAEAEHRTRPDSADAGAAVARWRNAVAARGGRAEAAAESLRVAEVAEAAARRRLAKLHDSIRRKAGG